MFVDIITSEGCKLLPVFLLTQQHLYDDFYEKLMRGKSFPICLYSVTSINFGGKILDDSCHSSIFALVWLSQSLLGFILTRFSRFVCSQSSDPWAGPHIPSSIQPGGNAPLCCMNTQNNREACKSSQFTVHSPRSLEFNRCRWRKPAIDARRRKEYDGQEH